MIRTFLSAIFLAANCSVFCLASGNELICPAPSNFTITSVSNVTSTSVTVAWTQASATSSYEVFVTSPAGVGNTCGTTGLSCTVSGLSPNTTYTFRVRATHPCIDGSGGFASKDSGNTMSATTLSIQTPNGLFNSSIQQQGWTANWSSVSGATGYTVEVRTSPGNVFVNSVTSTTNSKAITGLTPGNSYSWSVRANSPNSNSPFSTSLNVTLVPGDPVATAADVIEQNSFTAHWGAQVGTASYRLDVSTSSNFGSMLPSFDNLTLLGTSSAVTGLAPGTSYFYRIRATNTNGTSGNSNTIIVLTKPTEPVTIDAGEITQISFVAKWNGVPSAVDYRIDVSTDNFNSFLPGFEDVQVAGNSLSVGGLSAGGVYQYRVRAVNTSGSSGNSNITEVALSPGDPIATAAVSISIDQFDANWNAVPGATAYRLDVSTSNLFDSFLPGFNDLNVSGTSATVTGLSPGSTYFYRVRATNTGGNSGNSNTIGTITKTSAPLALSASTVGQTSFNARWNAVAGAVDYRLDVSEDDFTTMVTGFDDAVVTTTSVVVNGLSAGKTYRYRVRASNASGASANSEVIETILIPGNPILNAPTQITQNSFSISWQIVPGASSYQIDVASNSNFTSFVPGFQNKTLTATSDEVTGLSPGFTYFIRVRALNESGSSGNSSTLQQVVVPSAPLNIQVKESFPTQFVITWPEAAGATFYEAQVSRDDAFTDLLPGFDSKRVEGLTEMAVQNLTPSTIYFVRMRSGNEVGISNFGTSKTVNTANSDGSSDFVISIGSPVFNSVFDPSGSSISISVAGGLPDRVVKFYHRPVIEGDFEELVVNSSSSTFQVAVEEQWLDDLGMEFFFEASDASQEKSTPINMMRQPTDQNNIPGVSFGGSLKDYRIISIPYALENNLLDNFFEPTLGSYDKGKWRLVRFQGGKNVDYLEGLSKTKFDRGKGFWFNSLNEVSLAIPASQNSDNTRSKPFQLVMEAGWNQIGNPYPFPIDWATIQQHNGDVALGPLLGYNSDEISLEEINVLQPFEGGFVFSDEPTAIEIPVNSGVPSSGGRKASNKSGRDRQPGEWWVPVTLRQGEMISRLNGFGMLADAKEDNDENDLPVAPRFIRYLEWEGRTMGRSRPMSKDIVPIASQYTWAFDVNHNTDEEITITWNATEVPGPLFLYDETDHLLVNMKTQERYTFGGDNRSFNVHYGMDVSEVKTDFKLGVPYPNPATSEFILPWSFEPGQQAKLKIISVGGSVVYEEIVRSQDVGIQKIIWDLHTASGTKVTPGLYLYELVVVGNQLNHFRGRFFIQ